MSVHIGIIGGGLTGAAAAIQLLRSIDTPFQLTIIEPEARLGRGLAYGRADPFHLLNVRAGKLGVIASRPNDFAEWAERVSPRSGMLRQGLSLAFLPRISFGRYVEDRLRALVAARRDVTVTHLQARATAVRPGASGYEVLVQGQPGPSVMFLILATGYGQPRGGRLGLGPFDQLDQDVLRRSRSALFVGTGLTMIDAFSSLRARGYLGTAVAMSRRGLLPEVHRSNEASSAVPFPREMVSLR